MSKLQPNNRTYIFIAVTLVVVGVVVTLLLSNFSDRKAQVDTARNPQSGSYKIIDTHDILCTLSYPPTCSGSLILGAEGSKNFSSEVVRGTAVRYQNKETVIFPGDLKPGMTAEVTFTPNSTNIETLVITGE